jgi:hypothetical protein
MQAYKLVCSGVYAIIMAEDDEAVMQKTFGHLEKTRADQEAEGAYPTTGAPKLVANGGLWRLGEEDDEPLTFLEVWTNEVKFIPPTGTMQ